MGSFLVKHVVLAAFTVLTWLFWLGPWNHEGGEYAIGWIIGCVLTLVAVLACAGLSQINLFAAVLNMTVAFTVTWTTWAAVTGDAGNLFLLGSLMIFVAMSIVGVLLALILERFLAQSPVPERM